MNGEPMSKIFTLVKKTAKKPIPFVKKKGVETITVPLECLKAASGLIPVPALGPATDIVLSILKKVDQSQQNTVTAREIANLCLKAHVTLSEHLQSVEITPTLLESIQQFEADLHDVENTVEYYEQKMSIDQIFYSKSYSDELQRLEKRVNSTLSLFQIKKLLSLEETCAKIYASMQRNEQNTVAIYAYLQRIEQNTAAIYTYLQRIEHNTVVLMNRSEPASKPEEPLVDIVRRSDLTLCEEIIRHPGYSLQRAEMHGKIVTIRVFTGCKAKSTWEASNMFDLKVMHPNLPHLIGASSSDERVALFSVYDLECTDIKHDIFNVIPSWSVMDFDILGPLLDKVDHDVTSAWNHLCEQTCWFALSNEHADYYIFCDAHGRFVLSFSPAAASSLTALVSPAIFDFVMGDTRHNVEVVRVNHIGFCLCLNLSTDQPLRQ
ncbi:uncharacterized protein EV420DRAFT_1754628 [Desarmillaria tabescens]|uniref:Uncharacterized protein n=1 Tax=Armillaria tabescens TaxID=1929756 RepID=A0AA39MGK7_ARMTA|nr:uncharacterized protein EV420DRAFT_1754628 [Desarmillaria tabescens]KAK0434056.1 hypothetical protein EV420DRAFT_1754628 [Desarmillaria tabescens]